MYKGRRFDNPDDFHVFLKSSLLRTIFKKEYLGGIRVDFGHSRFIVYIQTSGRETQKPEEIAGILSLDPDYGTLDKTIVEKIARKKGGFRTGDLILGSKQGLYVDTQVLAGPRRRTGRKLFRSILSACAMLAQAQEAALNSITTTISQPLWTPHMTLDSIFTALATSLNPVFTGGKASSQALLPLSTWRKFYNLNANELDLVQLHQTIAKHIESLAVKVPSALISNFLAWLQATPTPHFETYIETVMRNTMLTLAPMEQLNLSGNTKKTLHELITHYLLFAHFGKEGRIPSSGYVRITDLAKTTHVPPTNFYGNDGIIAQLRNLNLIETAQEPSSGRRGTAIVIRISLQNPTIIEYLRLLQLKQPKVKLSTPPADGKAE